MSLNKKEKTLKALKLFRQRYEEGKIVSSKKYQKKLVLESIEHFIKETKNYEVKELVSSYKKIFIILPANVPTEFFEFIPILLSYNAFFFFKLPKRNRIFIKSFFEILNFNNIKAEYLSHKKTLKEAKNFDFIIGSGSSGLEDFLKYLNKPYRYFGPKFSFAIMEKFSEKDLKSVVKDFLSFDTEGCLSVRFLFTKFDLDLKFLKEMIESIRKELYPQKDFDPYLFDYYNAVNHYYSKEGLILKREAVFKVNEFPKYFPQRTLFVKKYEKETEIIDFLEEAKNSVQAILNKDGSESDFFIKNTSVSLFLPSGRAQFPPLGWLFERGLKLDNFFII